MFAPNLYFASWVLLFFQFNKEILLKEKSINNILRLLDQRPVLPQYPFTQAVVTKSIIDVSVTLTVTSLILQKSFET